MDWASELVTNLQEKLDQALENVNALHKASSGNIDGEDFKCLQSQQDEILSQLLEADQKLCKEYGSKWYAQKPLSHLQIKDKIKAIEELNSCFIENMKVRKGLLEIELQGLSKTKRTFSKMKTYYGKVKKRLRINVFS
ncbi:MAG: hypothetical protein ACI9S8_001469 [Chlamydiales bacterium]|jgi:hypothetical protein